MEDKITFHSRNKQMTQVYASFKRREKFKTSNKSKMNYFSLINFNGDDAKIEPESGNTKKIAYCSSSV